MTPITVGENGALILPPDVRERFGLQAGATVRIVETRGGVLLVPLTAESPSPKLARELTEWQELGTAYWSAFAFDEDAPAVADALLGLFADAPEIVDALTEDAMAARDRPMLTTQQ